MYSSRADVRSWRKPPVRPQFSIYCAAARYSAAVTCRARVPSAPGWGVYWLMRDTSTSPGRKAPAIQSRQRRVFSICPGSTR